MVEERRKNRRISVEIWIEAEEGDELYFQRAANLSAGGAFFAQTVPQKVGTRVTLRFTLPGETSEIQCSGEIVSSSEKGLGMGVRFVDLSAEDRTRIEGLIERLSKEPEAT
jgi:uncharacterized protein (TIGR02266 family)